MTPSRKNSSARGAAREFDTNSAFRGEEDTKHGDRAGSSLPVEKNKGAVRVRMLHTGTLAKDATTSKL